LSGIAGQSKKEKNSFPALPWKKTLRKPIASPQLPNLVTLREIWLLSLELNLTEIGQQAQALLGVTLSDKH